MSSARNSRCAAAQHAVATAQRPHAPSCAAFTFEPTCAVPRSARPATTRVDMTATRHADAFGLSRARSQLVYSYSPPNTRDGQAEQQGREAACGAGSQVCLQAGHGVTLPQKNCAPVLRAAAQRAAYRSTHAVVKKLVNQTGAKEILALMEEDNADMAYASAVISLIKELLDKRNKHGAAKAVLNTNAAAKARARRGSLRPLCTTAFYSRPTCSANPRLPSRLSHPTTAATLTTTRRLPSRCTRRPRA